MAPTLFRILLIIITLYALKRGQRDERQVGIIMIAGVIATELVLPPVHQRFAAVESKLVLVDLGVFAGFLWVALRSERFWPMWIAGLQLTTLLGHVLKALDSDLFSRAYAAALVFWVYPILLIVAVGTWRGDRRRAREQAAAAA